MEKIKYSHKKLYFNLIFSDISVYNYLNAFTYDNDKACFMYSTKQFYMHCGLTTHACSKLNKVNTTMDLTNFNYLMPLTFKTIHSTYHFTRINKILIHVNLEN
jgi:hypothetical protein